jgi:hypothetical protein
MYSKSWLQDIKARKSLGSCILVTMCVTMLRLTQYITLVEWLTHIWEESDDSRHWLSSWRVFMFSWSPFTWMQEQYPAVTLRLCVKFLSNTVNKLLTRYTSLLHRSYMYVAVIHFHDMSVPHLYILPLACALSVSTFTAAAFYILLFSVHLVLIICCMSYFLMLWKQSDCRCESEDLSQRLMLWGTYFFTLSVIYTFLKVTETMHTLLDSL